MAARIGVAALAFFAFATAANAQSLQTLHVQSFTLTSSNTNPSVEEPFSVTLSIHVSERITHMDNVFLPTFIGAEEEGDLRSTSVDNAGTTYRETLQLVAHTAGPLDISPAYVDAIDARTHKPTRFGSNALRINVRGPVSQSLRTLATIAETVAAIAAAGLVVAVILLRRRARQQSPPALEVRAQEPAPQPQVTIDPLQEALRTLRERRDRVSVMRVRAELWNEVGAADGQTISDVLRLPPASDARTRRMLLALERAAFIDDERLQPAIDEVLQ